MDEGLDRSREAALRAYFKASAPKPRMGRNVGYLVGAALLLLVSVAMSSGSGSKSPGCAMVFAAPGIMLGLLGGSKLWRARTKHRRLLLEAAAGPSDDEVQVWLDNGLANVKDRSLRALGLSSQDLVADLLTIVAPVLWSTEGICHSDLLFRAGHDGCARFGIYSVAIIALTERHLGIFRCEYDFIRDIIRNENTCEYHYRDIVSVSTVEASSSFELPTGEKLTSVQEFRVSVPNGEAIRITIDAPEICRVTGIDSLPSTGADKAVQAIRAMLRDSKD